MTLVETLKTNTKIVSRHNRRNFLESNTLHENADKKHLTDYSCNGLGEKGGEN